MEKKYYNPFEVRELLHISPKALRYYIQKKLINVNTNAENGYHYFDQENLFDFLDITYLRQSLDFSVDLIKNCLESSSIDEYLNIFEDKQNSLAKEIERKQWQLQQIDQWIQWIKFFAQIQNDFQVIDVDKPIFYNEYAQNLFCIPEARDPALCSCGIFEVSQGIPIFRCFAIGTENKELHFPDAPIKSRICFLPGKYVYTTCFSDLEPGNPQILAPFQEWCKRQKIETVQPIVVDYYFRHRNQDKRGYFCDIFMPLEKHQTEINTSFVEDKKE